MLRFLEIKVVRDDFLLAQKNLLLLSLKELGKYTIQYQGAIDDNAGEPEKVTQHFLTNAMDELLLIWNLFSLWLVVGSKVIPDFYDQILKWFLMNY